MSHLCLDMNVDTFVKFLGPCFHCPEAWVLEPKLRQEENL